MSDKNAFPISQPNRPTEPRVAKGKNGYDSVTSPPMQTTGISVIINLTQSNVKNLEPLLKSLAQIRTQAPEVIITNPVSITETTEIIARHASAFFIRMIRAPHSLSRTAALNEAAKQAQHPFLLFLSPDSDYSIKDIDKALHKLQEPNLWAVSISGAKTDETSNKHSVPQRNTDLNSFMLNSFLMCRKTDFMKRNEPSGSGEGTNLSIDLYQRILSRPEKVAFLKRNKEGFESIEPNHNHLQTRLQIDADTALREGELNRFFDMVNQMKNMDLALSSHSAKFINNLTIQKRHIQYFDDLLTKSSDLSDYSPFICYLAIMQCINFDQYEEGYNFVSNMVRSCYESFICTIDLKDQRSLLVKTTEIMDIWDVIDSSSRKSILWPVSDAIYTEFINTLIDAPNFNKAESTYIQAVISLSCAILEDRESMSNYLQLLQRTFARTKKISLKGKILMSMIKTPKRRTLNSDFQYNYAGKLLEEMITTGKEAMDSSKIKYIAELSKTFEKPINEA